MRVTRTSFDSLEEWATLEKLNILEMKYKTACEKFNQASNDYDKLARKVAVIVRENKTMPEDELYEKFGETFKLIKVKMSALEKAEEELKKLLDARTAYYQSPK